MHVLARRALGAAGFALGCLIPVAVMAQVDSASGAMAPQTCSATIPVTWPEAGTRIERAQHQPGDQTIPAHCELFGIMHEHTGVDGQHYAVRFHMRLPDAWNGRFFFQGGGGSNGDIGDALGPVGFNREDPAQKPALALGYAVLSQDSGHSNALNSNPARGGATAFGFDPQARADYGHASLAPVTRAARAIIAAYYRQPIRYSYFVGCSKGGEEGMVLAQQHPDLFDGIIAAAPGFALPRAAVEETFQVQVLAALAPHAAGANPAFADFDRAFSLARLDLVGGAINAACDGLDGARDGIVSDTAACTTARVRPRLEALHCAPGQDGDCLSGDQIDAVLRLMAGGKGADGRPFYASWPWDPGLASPGWSIWKLGSPDGKVPALNIVLGGASLNTVFSVPPTAVAGDPQSLLDAQLAFSIERDGRRIYATGGGFDRSAWQDSSAHSADLGAFAARGGRLIVPHGAADPVFSLRDTVSWWDRVNARAGGKAASFVRVFPVPGMNHCVGGPATDHFDAFSALVTWVEKGRAPDSIPAQAGPQTPWPGRTRPLCPWPGHAHYKGRGSLEDAANFACAKSGSAKSGSAKSGHAAQR